MFECSSVQSASLQYTIRVLSSFNSSSNENYRRMTMDYEFRTEPVEAMLQITFWQIMLKKIIKKTAYFFCRELNKTVFLETVTIIHK